MRERTITDAVNAEATSILSDCNPQMLARSKAAFEQLTDAEYYEKMELADLYAASAYVYSRFYDPSTPMEMWLLATVTAAAEVGYLLGLQELKGAF